MGSFAWGCGPIDLDIVVPPKQKLLLEIEATGDEALRLQSFTLGTGGGRGTMTLYRAVDGKPPNPLMRQFLSADEAVRTVAGIEPEGNSEEDPSSLCAELRGEGPCTCGYRTSAATQDGMTWTTQSLPGGITQISAEPDGEPLRVLCTSKTGLHRTCVAGYCIDCGFVTSADRDDVGGYVKLDATEADAPHFHIDASTYEHWKSAPPTKADDMLAAMQRRILEDTKRLFEQKPDLLADFRTWAKCAACGKVSGDVPYGAGEWVCSGACHAAFIKEQDRIENRKWTESGPGIAALDLTPKAPDYSGWQTEYDNLRDEEG